MRRYAVSRVYLIKRFAFALSPRDHHLLVQLAWHEGEPMSVVLRRLVRNAAHEYGPWPPTANQQAQAQTSKARGLELFAEKLPPTNNPQVIQYYSCFICYSTKDQAFAERLHADLQDKGVRCWFASEDMRIGARIRPTLDESIWEHDKLLVVLSEHSIASQWVEQEIETALARERKEGRTVVLPIRLDDAVMEIESGWPAFIRNTRHIGDFRNWKDHDEYQKAFERLLRDLKAEDVAEADT